MQPSGTGVPIYSLEQLQTKGLDPAQEPCCHAPPRISGNPTVLGCSDWRSCRFQRKPYGTFKGVKPQRIGYYYRTIEGNEKTDQIACSQFVRTLQAAMDQGIADELAGRRHETVNIIAQEGESFKRVRRISKLNPKDQTTRWEKITEQVHILPMADDVQRDDYSEYRRRELNEYMPRGEEVLASEADPAGDREPTDEEVMGRPTARPVSQLRTVK